MRYCGLALVLTILFGIPQPAWSCETKHLTLFGALNRSTPLASVAQIPNMNDHPSFADLEAPPHYSTSLGVFDSLGIPHTVTIYLYQVSPRIWTLRAVVSGNEVAGGVANVPAAIAPDFGFLFTPSGARQTIGAPDVTFQPAWSTGAGQGSLQVVFALTQNDAPSAITDVHQDGRMGECSVRSDLDFDGDGKEDYAVWRRPSGTWAVSLSSTNNTNTLWKQWGLPGDYPMPGDYTGDGLADLVIWRPTNGFWYVCRSETMFDCSQPIVQQFGLPGDRPIRGDFDGDGILDLAVWRTKTGTFYFQSSRTGQVIARQWGLAIDIPLNTGANR